MKFIQLTNQDNGLPFAINVDHLVAFADHDLLGELGRQGRAGRDHRSQTHDGCCRVDKCPRCDGNPDFGFCSCCGANDPLVESGEEPACTCPAPWNGHADDCPWKQWKEEEE